MHCWIWNGKWDVKKSYRHIRKKTLNEIVAFIKKYYDFNEMWLAVFEYRILVQPEKDS